MRKENISFSASASNRKSEHKQRPHLSPAMKEVVRNNLRELESQSDEEFLIRAEMERKLSSL